MRKITIFLTVTQHGGQRSRSTTEFNHFFAQGHVSIAAISVQVLIYHQSKCHFFSPMVLHSWNRHGLNYSVPEIVRYQWQIAGSQCTRKINQL